MLEGRFFKNERLNSRKLISNLFVEANSLTEYPFRILWNEGEIVDDNFFQVAISVSKKRIPKAVDRNRMKRLIREAIRRNKEGIKRKCQNEQKKITIMIVYLDKIILDYHYLEHKINVTFQRLQKEICIKS